MTMSQGRVSKRDPDGNGQWRTVALSFVAGAASMSLFLYASSSRDRRRRRRRRRSNDSEDTNDDNSQYQHQSGGIDNSSGSASSSYFLPKSTSLIFDSVCQSVEDAVEDIKSRIGELPGRRSHWPWETIHKQPKKVQLDTTASATPEPDPNMKLTPEGGTIRENPELCIGSIFGLDVGGTLAKLVYFEQQQPDTETADSCTISHRGSIRAKHYHMAASAQAVLKARRGHDDEDNDALASSIPPPLQTHATLGGHEEINKTSKKSLTVGLLRRKLSSCSDFYQQDTNTDNNNNNAKKPVHTVASNDDIQNLYRLRQESVPDDLNAYASSVHFNDISTSNNTSPNNNSHNRRNNKHIRSNSDGTASTTSTEAAANFASYSNPNTPHDESTPTSTTSSGGMKKSRSMFDLSISQKSRDHAEALDRFYHFARKLDTYREGVKDHKLSFYSRKLGGEFHFIRFETRRMENAMQLIRANDLHLTIREMGATGGGAHKYANDWDRILGIQMKKQEELESMVAGMQFVLSTVVGECYTFRPRKPKTPERSPPSVSSSMETATTTTTTASSSGGTTGSVAGVEEEKKSQSSLSSSDESDSESGEEPQRDHDKTDIMWNWSRKVQRDSISYSSTYPYLLVTIGTGVSILRVDGPRKHERISGSTIGGGTYWGLIRLLTNIEEFEDVMRLAEHGDPTKVDMMVGDIYGNNPEALEKLGLPASLVASSFGKLVAKEDPAAGLTQEDLARALLLMVTNNIGQVAYLNAQLHKTSRIYFVGNFLRGNKLSQRRLSFAINYWSKGEMEALFLEHEGYFGALGAFLLSQDIAHDDLGPPRRQSNVSQSHSFRSSHRRSHTLEKPF